ncbi:MAG: RNA polymerase sigma-70 factor [Mangrovibacterium sp.]
MYTDPKNNFNRVYTDYYRKSFLFVKSYVHDDFVAEDIVSESMIKLWNRMKHEQIDHVQSYLFTILKNSALDHLKHEAIKYAAYKSVNERFIRELDIRISVLESSDPNEIFSSEIQEIVRITLASLPEKTRLVFEMSRSQYIPNKEIAEILGITVKGVDYHISCAIKELKRSLKDYLPLLLCFFFLK